MLLYAFIRFHTHSYAFYLLLYAFDLLLYAFICFRMLLYAFKAEVSEEEQQVSWSHVYRLLPAEAGKNI